MSTREQGRSTGRNVWMFMVATAMATTVSTLAATAMVKADTAQALEVTCDCENAEAVVCPSTNTPQAVTPTAPVAPATPAVPAVPADASSDTPAHAPATSMDVEGPLDKAIIRRVVRAHINEVRYCYNEGLARDPDLAGRVVVQFTVGNNGKVIESTVTTTTLPDADVSSCIAEAVARWAFPKPANGEKVVITYPFVLEPG
ncbi:MAG: AgmX/PglI C-terminal domain-containing protein [Myxococcota bacterium]